MSASVVWRSTKRIITVIGKYRKPRPPGSGGGNGKVGRTIGGGGGNGKVGGQLGGEGGGNGPNVDGSVPIGKITKFGSIK